MHVRTVDYQVSTPRVLLLAVACLGLLGCGCSFIVLSTQVDRVSGTRMVVLVVMVMKERVYCT